MKIIKTILYSDNFLKSSLYIFIAIYSILIILYAYISGKAIQNGDGYIEMFESYLQNGHYNQVAQGTSVFFNMILYLIYKITNHLSFSFFILNLMSQIFIIFHSYFLLKKYAKIKDNYFYIIATIFLLYLCNQKYYLGTANDYFLAVFIMLFLESIIDLNKKSNFVLFIKIALYLGIALSIRATAVLLIPLLVFKFYTYFANNNLPLSLLFKYFSVFFFVLLLNLFTFHYPALVEKKSLSYENKNPKKYNSNWIQRNYLGLKKIETQNLKPSRDVIWHQTKFQEVDNYLKENGKNSLPNSISKFVLQDPILFFKISIYNIITCFARYFRFWGLLIFVLFIPILNYFKKPKFQNNISVQAAMLFCIIVTLLSSVCLTFIEFRWFVGYEILIPICIIDVIQNNKNKSFTNLTISLSLLTITLFNIKSIFSYL